MTNAASIFPKGLLVALLALAFLPAIPSASWAQRGQAVEAFVRALKRTEVPMPPPRAIETPRRPVETPPPPARTVAAEPPRPAQPPERTHTPTKISDNPLTAKLGSSQGSLRVNANDVAANKAALDRAVGQAPPTSKINADLGAARHANEQRAGSIAEARRKADADASFQRKKTEDQRHLDKKAHQDKRLAEQKAQNEQLLARATPQRPDNPLTAKLGTTKEQPLSVTQHGVQQKITRKVRSADELDAIKNPLDIHSVRHDQLGRPSQRSVGERAEVVRNPDSGAIVSVNPTSTRKAERLKKNNGKTGQ